MRRSKAVPFPTTAAVAAFLLFAAVLSVAAYAHGDGDDDDDHSSAPTAAPRTNCAGDLKVDVNLIPFDTSSLRCYTAWSSQDFVLMYDDRGEPGLWSFVLTAPERKGYIAVGFSPTGRMVGSSAVVGWITATGKGIAKQYHLEGMTPEEVTPNSGNLALVDGKTLILSQSQRLYLAFQLNTSSQPSSKLIYAVGPDGTVPGSDLSLPMHSDEVSTTIDYSSGAGEESGDKEETLRKFHAYLALLGWGVVVPVGVLAARYGKGRDPAWFYAHLAIQAVGFSAGLGGIIAGFKLEDESGDEVGTHKSIGIAVLVLGALQMLAVLARPGKQSKVRVYWNSYHHNVGRAAIALAIANIFYGLHLAHEDASWRIGYGVFLGALGLLALLLEVRLWFAKD